MEVVSMAAEIYASAAEHHHDESSHAHTHHSYQSVLAQIEHLQLPAQVKADAAAIYRLIGEAESAIHNTH